MFPIPPNKPPIIPPKRASGVAPVEKIQERSVPRVTESPTDSERRERQERRQQARPRIKGYDLRSGQDRRKTARSTPIIDLDV
ncbi:MAG TPA: hypothetical protein PKC70_14820 [Cellvibrionaceae bacterium]|nr:hypothetical protein [Cellvibrionaceae bacterium]